MIRRLYDWVLGLANHPHALWALAVVAFLESSVFPIPPDVLMIPMILARPNRAWLIAGIALVASVLGACWDTPSVRWHLNNWANRSLPALAKATRWRHSRTGSTASASGLC